MCKWVETNGWKAFRDIVMMAVAIFILLFGNNKLGEVMKAQEELKKAQDQGVETTRLNISYLRGQIKDQMTTDSAPVAESKPNIDGEVLGRHNISLADYKIQIPQVQEWLSNPYSGYPALADAIRRVLGNSKLVGNAVPLTIINAKNLNVHGRGTDNPIISSAAIKDMQLRDAIYASWAEKNSGSLADHKSFKDIVVPIP